MTETTAQIIERAGLIPVLRARNAAQAHTVVRAMMAGGVTVVEVTMTVPGALELLKELKQEYGAKLLLGSGTVTTAEEAQATIQAGAEFVVSPSLHPEVIAATRASVKVFPCSAMGGASYLKSLLAPFPHLKLIPTGGVTLETAESFLRAGACALGVGSDLVNLAAIDQGTPEKITEAARAYLEVLARVRG